MRLPYCSKTLIGEKIRRRLVRGTAECVRDGIDNRFVPFSNTEPAPIQSNCCLCPDGFVPSGCAIYSRKARRSMGAPIDVSFDRHSLFMDLTNLSA
jgi:hypothetical protein